MIFIAIASSPSVMRKVAEKEKYISVTDIANMSVAYYAKEKDFSNNVIKELNKLSGIEMSVFQAKDVFDRFDKVILTMMITDLMRLRYLLFIEVHIADVFRY